MRLGADARRAAVVVNATSRRGAGAYERTVDLLVRAGVPVVTRHAVVSGADLCDILERVVSDDHDLLVVGGGDGSIGYAAGVVAGTDVTLGIVPLGTANDFSRTLQLPTDLEAACRTVASGKVVDIDLGRVDGRAYVNVASVGLSVGVTESLTPGLKRRLGPLAYPVAVVRAYRRHTPFRARLEFPGGERDAFEVEDLLQVASGTRCHRPLVSTTTSSTSTPSSVADCATT